MVRAVRPTDALGLLALQRRPGARELTTHTWPKVQPESGHLGIGWLLRTALGAGRSRRRDWVAEESREIAGYLVVTPRCDGIVWDVEHLYAEHGAAAESLLEHTCTRAVSSGARRVFLEVPARDDALRIARRAGFERYAGSTLLRLSPPFGIEKAGVFAARPRLRADDHGLYQLYNAAVPAVVRSAEAMTYEEWSALHRGRKKWAPTLFGDRHQYVWEMGAGLIGWMEVTYGHRSQYLELRAHPQYESILDRLVGYALTQVSPKAPVYATAREYQPALQSALLRSGFAVAGEVEILVRQLAARMPATRLVPANVVGG